MKRIDVLNKIGVVVPSRSIKNVIVDTDARNEADDQFAIMHHLLSPSINVLGIIAAHYEGKDRSGQSMQKSYDEILKVLKIAEIDDVSVFKGSTKPIGSDEEESDGVNFIIEEAKKYDKVYICCMGALTNIAAALKKAPEISEKLVIIVNGGGPYPKGRFEFNFMQDINAARIVFASTAEIWQVHQDVYSGLEVSIAELRKKVYPCGEIGKYLYENLVLENEKEFNPVFLLRTGENWTLGDNTTIGVLLMNNFRGQYQMEMAPIINDDGTYTRCKNSKYIRVYSYLDYRFILEDFFSKLELAYK